MATASAGDTINWQFTTKASTKALVNADSLPVGTLVKNGVDTAITVTVTNKSTGVYVAQFTIPATYAAGDEVALRINATIGGVVTAGIPWQRSLISGATVAAGDVDYVTNLVTIRDQISARLVEITAGPKPSYSVNGQTIQWSAYFNALTQRLSNINELIAAGEPDTQPFEEVIIGI